MSYRFRNFKTVTIDDFNAHIERCTEDGVRFGDPECGWTWLAGYTQALRIPKSMSTDDKAVKMACAYFTPRTGQTINSFKRTDTPHGSLCVVTVPDDFMSQLYDADAHHGDALNLFDVNGVVNHLLADRVSITYTAPVTEGIGPVGGHFEVDCIDKIDQREVAGRIFPHNDQPDAYRHPIELNVGRIASTFGVEIYGEDTGKISIWRRLLDDLSFLGFEYNGGVLGFGEIGTAELTEDWLVWRFTLNDLLRLEDHPRTPRTRVLRVSAGARGAMLPTGYAASLMHRLPGGVGRVETEVCDPEMGQFSDYCTFKITWTWPVLSEQQAVEIARVTKPLIGESFINPVANYIENPIDRLSWSNRTKHLP